MKTIAEKLDDLKQKLENAKSDEERKEILDEISELQKEAEKVLSSLKNANQEAKKYREQKEEIETELEELKKKDKDNDVDSDYDEDEESDKKDKDKEKKKKDNDEEMPAWAKKLFDKVDTIEQKTKQQKRQELINSKLKEKKIPVELSKFLKIDGETEEDIGKAVNELEQTIKDNKLLNIPIPESGSGEGIAENLIKEYAKSKDNKSKDSKSIQGKKIEVK